MSELSPTSTDNFQFIHNNTELVKVSGGVDPKTKISRDKLVSRKKGIDRIEKEYLGNTDDLIGILDGTIRKSEKFLDGEARSEAPIDCAVYLDKSARPVRKLVSKLWDEMSQSKKPASMFLNIDKEDYLSAMGFDAEDLQDVPTDQVSLDKLDPDFRRGITAQIRAMFLAPNDLDQLDENNIEDVWNMPTQADGKHIAVIDEVKSSGNTLRIADMLLQEALPDAIIEPCYWSAPGLVRWQTVNPDDGSTTNRFAAESVPAWYDDTNTDGRGIGNRSPERAKRSRTKFTRIGKHILSLPQANSDGSRRRVDKTTLQVNHDLKLMTDRFKLRQANYVPGLSRSDEEYDQSIEEYYGMPFKQWIEARRAKEKH